MRAGARRPARAAILGALCALAASVALLGAPLLFNASLPRGSDVHASSHYLLSFSKALREGDLYPRWTDRSNQDLGAPMFVFYPPLTYYAASGALWLAGSVVVAFKLYLIVLSAVTFVSFYALAREWIGPGLPAAVGAAIYLLLPYHVLDVYQRFALAETTAFVFFPLVLLFARRTLSGARARDFGALSLTFAGLLYTHVISAFMFSLFLGIWMIWEARGRWRSLWRPLLALACGAGLAAPVLLPSMLEKQHVNIVWAREMPNGDFRINFIFKDEVLPGLGIKDPVKPPVLKSAHAQLLLAAIAAGLALTRLPASDRRRRRDVLTVGGGCALAYFLQLELSTPIWQFVPELPTIQFPWRFQTLMVLGAALLAGFAVAAGRGGQHARKSRARRSRVIGTALLAGAVGVNLALAYQNAHLKPFDFDDAQTRRATVVHWSQPALTPVEFKQYRQFKQMRVEVPRVAFREGSGTVREEQWLSSRRRLTLRTASGGTVELRSFWFPGWTATLSGAALELRPSPHGTITFQVPPGEHTVELRFGATPVRRAAGWVALLALLATPLLARATSRTGR